MNSFKLLIRDIKSIIKDPKVLIPVLAVLLIPLLYSATFLWAFWDPYAKLDHLPVAVVNLDKGAKFNGQDLNIGRDLTDQLKDNQKFDWQFVGAKQAREGLEHNKYYMVIEIPADFSQKAATITEDHPTPAEFRFIPNESYNFLASQIGENAVDKIKEQINNNLTEAYTKAIFANIDTLANGLAQASDGSQQLADGARATQAGVNKIKDNLNKLAAGTVPLQKGLTTVAGGSSQLHQGLLELQQGTHQLADGLSQLSQGNSQLLTGAKQSQAGMKKLQTGLDASVEGLEKVQTSSQAVSRGLEQYVQAHPELAEDPQLQKLVVTSKQVTSGMATVVDSQKQLAAGAAQLTAGQTELVTGMATFSEKLNQAKDASQSIDQGAARLVQGSAQLETGLAQVNNGFQQLSDGTYQLSEGTDKLTNGMSRITNGTEQLAHKLTEAANKTSQIKGNDQLYSMFADPVQMQKQSFREVPNYGTGFTPYFLSLGLFVGALILTIVIPLREPSGIPGSAFSWFLGKFMLLAIIGTVQAVIADLVLLYGLHIEVKSVPLFFIFSIITSLTFMALVQFLVTAFDNPGRFVAILILIWQLVTSAGTFPLELIPTRLQVFNHWLPMTYSVFGFKAVISSGDFSFMWQNAKILAIFIISMSIGTILYYTMNYKRNYAAAAPVDEVATVS